MHTNLCTLLVYIWCVGVGSTEVIPGDHLEKLFSLFSVLDTPLSGKYLPTISFEYVLANRFARGRHLAEIIIFHESQKDLIGLRTNSSSYHLCCSFPMYREGLCDHPDTVMMGPNSTRAMELGYIFYFYQAIESFGNGTFYDSVHVNHTGFWYIYLVNCHSTTGQILQVSGKSQGLNVYGYLPATVYGNLFVWPSYLRGSGVMTLSISQALLITHLGTLFLS
eukprot:TRINITY_DN4809_c0_g1_i18.p1 TRINITY_DN4809_c0_g1~~TRINITY_DN4809_c0_g1_i18.p1  ORF type:complete len:234 (-),score=22.09 TRINITY_DN4809_c0_g1_i18:981-1646(-)